jgi:hypothetical protein
MAQASCTAQAMATHIGRVKAVVRAGIVGYKTFRSTETTAA